MVQMEVEMEPSSSNVNNETFVAVNATPTGPEPPNPVAVAIQAAAAAAAAAAQAGMSPQLDSTFNVAPPKTNLDKKASLPQDSIMTEDLSMAADEKQAVKQEPTSPPRRPASVSKAPKPTAASAKKHNEIFK